MNTHNTRPAFSLIEVLITAGVIAVLLGVLVPTLGATRQQAMGVREVVNVREMSFAVTLYGGQHDDSPPVMCRPEYNTGYGTDYQVVSIRGAQVRMGWFTTPYQFHLMFSPSLPFDTLIAPGNHWGDDLLDAYGTAQEWNDYALTTTLYAAPSYWDRQRQSGPEQFGAQRLGRIEFPSNKGLLMQIADYSSQTAELGLGGIWPAGTLCPVAWADGSAGRVDLTTLEPGEPSGWAWGADPPPSMLDSGPTIMQTKDGVLGFDR